MHPALLVAFSLSVPVACLGLLLFLSWLEDTLNDDVMKTERRHSPAPITTMPATQAVVPDPASPTTTVRAAAEAEEQQVVTVSTEDAVPQPDPVATRATA